MLATTGDPAFDALDNAPVGEEDLTPDELAEVERSAAELQLVEDDAAPDADVEQVWAAEIVRRLEDLRAGRIKTIPYAEAMAHVQARLRSVRG